MNISEIIIEPLSAESRVLRHPMRILIIFVFIPLSINVASLDNMILVLHSTVERPYNSLFYGIISIDVRSLQDDHQIENIFVIVRSSYIRYSPCVLEIVEVGSGFRNEITFSLLLEGI